MNKFKLQPFNPILLVSIVIGSIALYNIYTLKEKYLIGADNKETFIIIICITLLLLFIGLWSYQEMVLSIFSFAFQAILGSLGILMQIEKNSTSDYLFQSEYFNIQHLLTKSDKITYSTKFFQRSDISLNADLTQELYKVNDMTNIPISIYLDFLEALKQIQIYQTALDVQEVVENTSGANKNAIIICIVVIVALFAIGGGAMFYLKNLETRLIDISSAKDTIVSETIRGHDEALGNLFFNKEITDKVVGKLITANETTDQHFIFFNNIMKAHQLTLKTLVENTTEDLSHEQLLDLISGLREGLTQLTGG
jgi:hypothetical protein